MILTDSACAPHQVIENFKAITDADAENACDESEIFGALQLANKEESLENDIFFSLTWTLWNHLTNPLESKIPTAKWEMFI